MWIPFLPIASLTTGLLSSSQHSLDTSLGAVTRLKQIDLSTFAPYIEFARAAYCDPNKIVGWECGDACNAVPDFMANLTGGDGDGTQYYYVGYWPTQSSVVVAHQGTNPHEMLAVLTDLKFNFMPLNRHFPEIPSDIEAHSGFVIEHMKTANKILAEVKRLMDAYSSTSVVLVGHSLGGALAELDTLFMTLNLPAGTTIRGVTFGTPRVGNVAWATFFDSQVSNFTRINNKRDPVPVIPGRLLGFGFKHPATEIHIQPDGKAVICPGPDDGVDPQCSDKLVRDAFTGNKSDHNGPYNGILIGTEACTP